MSSDRYHALVDRLRQAVVHGAGVTDSSVRAAIEARAAAAAGVAETAGEPRAETPGGPRPETATEPQAETASAAEFEELPEVARAFVDKVIRHAYRVTDADVEALRGAGLSEDAIFELTVTAALGAGRGRLERGLAALRGEV